ncbi:MAG: PD-(D/E)XK nuclease family protein [Verrucomicrobia bacterium]|nr:PD-(D/E)XK nuclease family protein [Verrucomicrobiota bacterium]
MGETAPPTPTPAWLPVVHASELAPWLLRNKAAPDDQQSTSLAELETLPVFAPLLAKWSQTILPAGGILDLACPDKLFGKELATSVSALEDYAACPFRFFVARGLRAEERKQFEIDERERGSFQHEALKEFHLCLQKQGWRWRDLRPEEARVLIRQVGETLRPRFRNGLFEASAARRFHAETLLGQLEKLVVVLIAWAPQYGFDPHSVEVAFGFPDSPLPGWRLELPDGRGLRLRGLIDRIDLCRASGTDEALVAVIDYKSTVKPLHATKLQHGLQLQLLSYLGVLRHLDKPSDAFGVGRLKPAGVFYVGLCGKGEPSPTRDDALAGQAETARKGFQHLGRFDVSCQNIFDTRPGATVGDQFRYKFKQDGGLAARGNDALPANEFQQLLDANENHLQRIGREIFAGQAGVSPFRTGSETACDYCKFRPVCRFDPWVEPYRVLRPPLKPPKAEKPRKPARKEAGGLSA